MKLSDYISTDNIPTRLQATFIYTSITLITILVLNLYVLPAYLSVVVGVTFGSTLAAFNKFEPRLEQNRKIDENICCNPDQE